MTHPHLGILLKAFEQGVLRIYCLQIGTAILTGISFFHLTSKRIGNILCAIADAEHGQFANKLVEVNLKSLRIMYRIRRTTQDDTDDIGVVFGKLVIRHNLAEGIQFTDTTANELRGL